MAEKKKTIITLIEIVLLSIVWTSASFVWKNILTQGLTMLFGMINLHKYTTEVLVAVTLLVAVYLMVLLITNIDIGRSRVFELTEEGASF